MLLHNKVKIGCFTRRWRIFFLKCLLEKSVGNELRSRGGPDLVAKTQVPVTYGPEYQASHSHTVGWDIVMSWAPLFWWLDLGHLWAIIHCCIRVGWTGNVWSINHFDLDGTSRFVYTSCLAVRTELLFEPRKEGSLSQIIGRVQFDTFKKNDACWSPSQTPI